MHLFLQKFKNQNRKVMPTDTISQLFESQNDDEDVTPTDQEVIPTDQEGFTVVNEPPAAQEEPELATELLNIKNLIEDLSSQFQSKLKYDKHKEEIIDRLHSENQSYKNDLFKKIIMPFVTEVILLIDDYTSLYKKHSEIEITELDTEKLLKQFGSIPDDLEELLYKNGIESYTNEEDTVDFAKQKVVKTVPTEIPEKDKTICERIKKGYLLEGKIIRQEQVSCYKFEEKIINN